MPVNDSQDSKTTHFVKRVVPESAYIGTLSALYWAPRIICSEYALAAIRTDGKKVPSMRKIIRNVGGYMPHFKNLRSPILRHPGLNVWYQLAGNTATHRTAEMFTDNLALVSCAAALGAVPGTQAIVKGVIRKSTASVPMRLKFIGFSCECLREAGYNYGALNAIKQVHRLELNTTSSKLVAVGGVSAATGAVTGVFHAASNTFYAGRPIQTLFNTRKALANTGKSCLIRAGYIGLTFFTATAIKETYHRLVDKDPVDADDASQNELQL